MTSTNCAGHALRDDGGAARNIATTKSVADVAAALGGDVGGPFSILAPGPNHSPRDRSLSVMLSRAAPEGFVVHSFAGDDPIVCRDYVRQRLGLPSFRRGSSWRKNKLVDVAAGRMSEPRSSLQANNQAIALAIWSRAVDPRGSLAERYLNSRGLVMDDDLAGRVIRFSSSEPLKGKRHPAMVVLYRNIHTDAPSAIQRTWLTENGEKIVRLTLGPAKGAAIKIDADEDVTTGLVIGEGFETSLSARQSGVRPCWAAGSKGAIANFPVLSGIECLMFLEETGKGANAAEIEKCAERWIAAGKEAIAITPTFAGDFNDPIRGAV